MYSLAKVITGRHGNVVLRATVVRVILEYWARRGADWTPHEGLIQEWVQRHRHGVDPRTVRTLLDALVGAKMLRRVRTTHNVLYQLPRRYADPNWAGFAPEIDDLLVEPMGWVRADGTFLRIGLPNPPYPHLYVVPTFPHYFAQHVWTRGWLHALNQGFLATPNRALELVREAAREAPLHVLWKLQAEALDERGLRRLRDAFAQTSLARRTQSLAADEWPTHPTNAWRKWVGWTSEAALELLHGACGHLGLGTGGVAAPQHPEERVDEGLIYELLDASVRERLLAKALQEPSAFLEAAENLFDQTIDVAWLMAVQREGVERGDHRHPHEIRDLQPPLELLEPHIRAMEPELRSTMVLHRWAWPLQASSPLHEVGAESPAPWRVPRFAWAEKQQWRSVYQPEFSPIRVMTLCESMVGANRPQVPAVASA